MAPQASPRQRWSIRLRMALAEALDEAITAFIDFYLMGGVIICALLAVAVIPSQLIGGITALVLVLLWAVLFGYITRNE